ncbi:MAG: tripartite tricarboxylate transporter substrate binding protein [Betaproteobacteria bacterium]|nr:tripartite tricarboxylate transporter substrate binding protein [Betaproteobacteria bacterium]
MKFTIACLLAGSLAIPAASLAYPDKPVRLVVGFPPGGGADAAARQVAQGLHEKWGQAVVVDNRAGAGGNVATEIVAKSNADGYTLLVTSPGPVAINPSLMKLPYNPRKDLAPITLIAFGPNVLVVNPASSATHLKDLIALARASPKRLNYASSGVGTTPHLSAELLKLMAKVDMVHVAYKGAGPAVIDVVGGRIDLMIVSAPTVLGQIRAQRLRALGVTSLLRLAVLPDVPTFSEAGLPGYEAGVWWGLLAPAGTPSAIIGQINREAVTVLQSANTRSRISASGAEVVANTSRAFGEFIEKETVKWATVIKAAGIKVE